MRRIAYFFSIAAAASLAGCSSGGSTNITQPNMPNMPQPPAASRISIVAGAQTMGTGAFTPNPLTISLANGGVVTWTNNDQTSGGYGGGTGTTHNINADDGSFSSGLLMPGNSFQATFGTAGTFGYHCSIHPTMKGTVQVTP